MNEEQMAAAFPDAPIMLRMAACESKLHQFDADGSVHRGSSTRMTSECFRSTSCTAPLRQSGGGWTSKPSTAISGLLAFFTTTTAAAIGIGRGGAAADSSKDL